VTWLIHTCDMTHSYVWHDSFICVTGLIHMCDMTHSYVWHDSFICVTCLIYMRNMPWSYVWHVSFICVACRSHTRDTPQTTCVSLWVWWADATWLIHVCDTTHSYVWHDSFICVTWPIHTRDMTHSYTWHDSFIYLTWLIHTRDMAHSYMWHNSFIYVTWLIHICDMTRYSPLHLECYSFILESESLNSFSSSLSPSFIENGPMGTRLEIEIEKHSKCNWPYNATSIVTTALRITGKIPRNHERSPFHTATMLVTFVFLIHFLIAEALASAAPQ